MGIPVIKKLEHGFKRLVLALLSVVLRRGDARRWPVDPSSVHSILILRPDKLGDMIVTVPLMHIIKTEFPHIRIEIVASPHNQVVIRNDSVIDEIHLYSKGFFDVVTLLTRLRRRHFDIIYDPICHDSATGLLMSHIIGKGAVLVASRKMRLQQFYDYCLEYEPDGKDHNIDNGLLLLNVLGRDPDQVDPFVPVFVPESDRIVAHEFIDALPQDGCIRIGVNISAGSPSRVLSDDKYIEIMRGIAERHGNCSFVLICTPPDRSRGHQIVEESGVTANIVPDGLSLLAAAAVIEKLDVLISPDTSLVHMAGLARVPVVGLYCNHPRNYEFWKPYRQQYGSVVAKSAGNIHDIEASQVIDEFFRLIESHVNQIPTGRS